MAKTSKNKLYNINFEKNLPNTPTCRRSSMGWVNWGARNNYPTQLLALLAQSPTLSACCNFAVKSLVGGGVDYEAMGIDGSQLRPNYLYSYDELIRRCAIDYFTLGNFALQIIKNRDNTTYSIYHQPIETVRCAERDADGVITDYYICRDWSSYNKYKPIQIPSLITRDDGSWILKSGQAYLLVSEQYNPISDYYPQPIWGSAIKAVQAEVEHLNFDLKSASNSFVPAGALSLPAASSEEAKQAILKNVQEMLVGSSNASQLLVSFRDTNDEEPVKFTPFTASEKNQNLFEESSNRAISRILSTFSIPSRTLIGYPAENTGFASEGALLEAAYKLYETLSGNDSRRAVVGVINDCLRNNGIDIEILMRPISFGVGLNIVNGVVTSDEVSEENVEEQQFSTIGFLHD